MDRNIARDQWGTFFKEFSDKNRLRATRLEILDENGAQSEETGLPLAGVDLEIKGTKGFEAEILLGGEERDNRHLSHTIPRVCNVKLKLGADGSDSVLYIESENRTRTLLHLEDLKELTP